MEDDLNLILAAYTDAVDGPGGTHLRAWVERYPQHRDELVRYAVHHHLFREADRDAVDDPALEARMSAVLEERREELMERIRGMARRPPPRPFEGIVNEAQARGLTARGLAERLGIGLVLLTRLDRRLLRAGSVPRTLVAQTAEALARSFDEVAAYLRLGPTLSRAASYKAPSAPSLVREAPAERLRFAYRAAAGPEPAAPTPFAGQQDFAQAVQTSPDMTPDQKQAWLEAAGDTLGDEE